MAVKISIVMPVYNGVRHLAGAMGCILSQSLREIELICVDDASTDGTVQAIEAYMAEDPRVRLVRHEENRGILMARKTGTLQAQGEYIMYMDQDDAYETEACAKLLRAMEETGAEMIHFGTRYETAEGFQIAPETGAMLERDASDAGAWEGLRQGPDLLESFFIAKNMHWAIWNKIYRADLAKRIFNLIGEIRCNLGEDIFTTFLALANANRVGYRADKLYVYRLGVGFTSVQNERKALAVANEYRVYRMLEECLTEAQRQDPKIAAALRVVRDDFVDAVVWNLTHASDQTVLAAMLKALTADCDAVVLWGRLRETILRQEAAAASEHEEWAAFEKRLWSEISQLQQGLADKETYYTGLVGLRDEQIAQLQQGLADKETYYTGLVGLRDEQIAQLQQEKTRLEAALEKRQGILERWKSKRNGGR